MARTRVHRPRNKVTSGTETELSRHSARDWEVRFMARKHNRRNRKTARAQIGGGQYDALATQGTGRHTGLWAAS